jgi:CRISPR-associated protein Csy1
MDAFFSCAEMEPVAAASHYSEQLIMLPGLGTQYRCPERIQAVSRSEYGLDGDHPLYLVPHAAVKIQPRFDSLVAGIAQLDQRARFVMFEDSIPALTKSLKRRIGQCFDQHGLDLQKHLTWLPRLAPAKFRSLLAGCDVLLDTPGFSGGNTSLDAIGQGLPLVTLPGAGMRSRQSAAMLEMCGAAELIAATQECYVEQAVRVANDAEYAARMRQKLLASDAVLFDNRQPLEVLVEQVEQLVSAV